MRRFQPAPGFSLFHVVADATRRMQPLSQFPGVSRFMKELQFPIATEHAFCSMIDTRISNVGDKEDVRPFLEGIREIMTVAKEDTQQSALNLGAVVMEEADTYKIALIIDPSSMPARTYLKQTLAAAAEKLSEEVLGENKNDWRVISARMANPEGRFTPKMECYARAYPSSLRGRLLASIARHIANLHGCKNHFAPEGIKGETKNPAVVIEKAPFDEVLDNIRSVPGRG
ncbi:MAG: hypothetical protein KGJ06_03860 [Pseudomonadota bacterium]|nr:hypothetical protein [Pseudomonadota bacterium]